MPTYDRAAQIAAVSTTIQTNDNNIGCTGWKSGAPNNGFGRTWPANLKVNNTSSSAYEIGSSCAITLSGNVYIAGTGGLKLDGGLTINVAEGLSTPPVILVDGPVNYGAGVHVNENSSHISVEFISFCSKSSANATCAVPSSSLTGTALYNSSQQTTVTVGGGGQAPGATFWAYWGKLEMDGSGTMGSAIAQSIHMSGGASVTFGTQLAVNQQTWTIRSYQRVFQ